MTEQEQLFTCATNDPDPKVRAKAAAQLNDDKLKQDLVSKEKELSVQQEIIQSIADEDILFELATSHPNRWIRKEAILRLQDDSHLMQIVFNRSEESELRYHAATRISDQASMKQILLSPDIEISNEHSIYIDNNLLAIRVNLAIRLEDDELLRKIAADKEEYERVRIAAIKHMNASNQDLFEVIAEEKPEDPDLYDMRDLRAAAVSRLTDEQLLQKYVNAWEEPIRSAAILALKDQEILKEIVRDEDGSNDTLEAVLQYIQDQDFLFDIAMHHTRRVDGPRLAFFAAKQIDSPDKLAEIAIGAATFEASEVAAENLHHDAQLLRILREIRENKVGKRASERWRDPVGRYNSHDLLAQSIQCIAAENLSDLRPLVQIVLDDSGNGIYMTADNFKEYAIQRLSDDPESMLEYVRAETDNLALDCARNCTDDQRVLQAIADNPNS